jgi:hypothetical protein
MSFGHRLEHDEDVLAKVSECSQIENSQLAKGQAYTYCTNGVKSLSNVGTSFELSSCTAPCQGQLPTEYSKVPTHKRRKQSQLMICLLISKNSTILAVPQIKYKFETSTLDLVVCSVVGLDKVQYLDARGTLSVSDVTNK